MEWYLKCLRQYADFNGRARRKECWLFCLFNFIFGFIAGLLDVLIGITIVTPLYALFVLVPGISVTVRRLHNVGKSGWFYFISIIPIIGAIWLFVLLCSDSQSVDNKWGLNPKI